MTKRFAVIDNGIVTNVVISDEALGANWREVDNTVNKGDSYDETTGEFTKAPVVETKGRERYITKAAFRRRMTLEEKVAIETSTDPVVAVLDKDLSDSTYVDLDLPFLHEGLDYIAENIPPFTPERIQELLVDGQDVELYKGDL